MFDMKKIISTSFFNSNCAVMTIQALNGSSLIAFLLYVLVGTLGAMTMRNVSDNMLQSMMTGVFGDTTEISSMVFAFFIIGKCMMLVVSVVTAQNIFDNNLTVIFSFTIQLTNPKPKGLGIPLFR